MATAALLCLADDMAESVIRSDRLAVSVSYVLPEGGSKQAGNDDDDDDDDESVRPWMAVIHVDLRFVAILLCVTHERPAVGTLP
jgi:hypothetical protein